MTFKRYMWLVLLIFSFVGGAFLWKVANTGSLRDESVFVPVNLSNSGTLLTVGGDAITQEDIEWEFSLLTEGVFTDPELTFVPGLEAEETQLSALKEDLTASLIERKLLFHFLKKDRNFNHEDPQRFTDCLAEWQKTIEELPMFFDKASDKDRLKNRLCEKAMIEQYLDERIFPQIVIDENMMRSYYTGNPEKFESPEQVVIRQVVLGSENEAKKWRYRIKKNNFSKIAEEQSIAPEASNGGLLGPFAKGEMPRVFDVAFSMRRGEIRGILKSKYGFHIIMLVEKISESKLTYNEAKNQIEELLLKSKKEEEYEKWVELALSAIPVKSSRTL